MRAEGLSITLLEVLVNDQWGLFWMGVGLLPQVKNFYLWSYLAFAVSSTMLPSESDRHAWLPLGLWALVLLALAVFAGAGPWMLERVAPVVNGFLNAAATFFGLSNAVHVVFIIPLLILHRALICVMKVYVV